MVDEKDILYAMKYSGTYWCHACTKTTRPQISEILSGFWKINISLNITYKGLLNTFALKYQLCIISEWILSEKVRRMDGIRSCGNLQLFSWASSCSGLSLLRYWTQWNQQQILGVSEIIHDIWGLFRNHDFRKRKSTLWNEFRTFPSLCSGGDTDGMTGKFFIKVMLLKVKTCSNPGQNSGWNEEIGLKILWQKQRFF